MSQAAGAAMSLHKSIREIERFLNGNQVAAATARLRAELHQKLEELGERWYRRGFKQGHVQSRKQLANGRVPKTLKSKVTRTLFAGRKRPVVLKSTL
jgi:hypothetical protein